MMTAGQHHAFAVTATLAVVGAYAWFIAWRCAKHDATIPAAVFLFVLVVPVGVVATAIAYL